MVWVRSLVPKEKKSAASAIRCAVSAARGNSIIVPIGMVSETPACAASDLGQDLLGLVPDQVQLHHRTDQRHHDLDLRVLARPASDRWPPRRPPGPAGANRPGVSSPSRTPRRPSIGFDSCSRSTAASSLRSASTGSPGVARGLGQRDLDRQLGAVRQELVQRRVEQPDRHRQPVHRLAAAR